MTLAICVCFGDLILGIQACMTNVLSPELSPQPHAQSHVYLCLSPISSVLYIPSCICSLFSTCVCDPGFKIELQKKRLG